MRAKRTVTVLSSDIRPALPNETIRFTHKNRKNMKPEYKPFVDALIELAIREDIGDGDHTSLCCIPATEKGRMRLLCKQEGILAGIEIAQLVLRRLDPDMQFEQILRDGRPREAGRRGLLRFGTAPVPAASRRSC